MKYATTSLLGAAVGLFGIALADTCGSATYSQSQVCCHCCLQPVPLPGTYPISTTAMTVLICAPSLMESLTYAAVTELAIAQANMSEQSNRPVFGATLTVYQVHQWTAGSKDP